jgi:hypothetical protein
MRVFERRPLTEGERAIARFMFWERFETSGVRVVQGPRSPFAAMVPRGRTILFSAWRARRDFARADAHERGWFVHELAHVWQARRGVVLATAKLAALGRAAYAYRFTPDKHFAAFNIEQQAEIARHLYLARIGEPDANGPALWELEAVWPLSRGPLIA